MNGMEHHGVLNGMEHHHHVVNGMEHHCVEWNGTPLMEWNTMVC